MSEQKFSSDEILGGLGEIRHTFNYEKVVIGSTLEAAVFSYLHKIPLIITGKTFFGFELLPKSLDLKIFGLNRKKQILENELWTHILFELSYIGLNAFSNYVSEITFNEKEKVFRVQMEDTYLDVKYDKCFIFSNEKISSIDFSNTIGKIGTYDTFDWFKIRKGTSRMSNILDSDSLVRKIVFPKLEKRNNEIVCVSTLTRKQLSNPEYNELMIRLIAEDILKTKTKTEFELEFSNRKTYEAWKSFGISTDSIFFNNNSISKILTEWRKSG